MKFSLEIFFLLTERGLMEKSNVLTKHVMETYRNQTRIDWIVDRRFLGYENLIHYKNR